jgi:hypothetical protein
MSDDPKKSTLNNLGYSGSLQDMEKGWLIFNSVNTNDLTTMWKEYLLNEGVTTSDITTMWMEFLDTNGYTGDLTRRISRPSNLTASRVVLE